MLGDFNKFEEWDIPNKPGIYAFRINILNSYELGLRPNKELTNKEDIEKIKVKIIKKICKLERILSSEEFAGEIKNRHKKFTFKQLKQVKVWNQDSIENKLKAKLENVKCLKEFVRIISMINSLLPPLYVGITYDQTLKERYMQHRLDHSVGKNSALGGRLESLNVLWGELSFFAKPISISNVAKYELELCEDIFQYLSNPILSLR